MPNDNNDYPASSNCSAMSSVTVSAFGEEDVPLEEAVDTVFKELQTAVNELHVQIRQMCMTEERGDSYEEAYQFQHAIKAHVEEGCNMLKELIKVTKQLLPPRPKGLSKDFEKTYKLPDASGFN